MKKLFETLKKDRKKSISHGFETISTNVKIEDKGRYVTSTGAPTSFGHALVNLGM